jgi:hypothetical protein
MSAAEEIHGKVVRVLVESLPVGVTPGQLRRSASIAQRPKVPTRNGGLGNPLGIAGVPGGFGGGGFAGKGLGGLNGRKPLQNTQNKLAQAVALEMPSTTHRNASN